MREFSGPGQGEGTEVEPGRFPELRRQSGETKATRIHRNKYQKGESITERPKECPPQVFSRILMSK